MSVKMPYEFCFWVSRRLHDADFFHETLHGDNCRYSKGNYFSFSGTVAAVSQDLRKQAAVTIGTGHSTRHGFFLRIEGLADVQPPFIITDALNTSFGGFYELEFSPQDPEIIWASRYDRAVGGGLIVYPVASESFFGRIHFTGKTSAFVMVFGTSDSLTPRIGDPFWFPDDPEELLGKVQRARPVPAWELDDIFIH